MTPAERLQQEVEADLLSLSENGLLRKLRLPNGVDLVSNDFLGLASHPQILERMASTLGASGVGAGGSRLLRGHRAVFADLEERLAQFSGTEAALLFTSGYAANQGLLQCLVKPDDLVLSDALNHASLIDALRLTGARKFVFPHQDLGALEAALRAPRPSRTFIVTESVFGMDGDLTPLADMADLCETYGALLIVDEAHATGLYGPRGAGRVEELGLRDRVLATVHTGGKALGAGGAWVAGPPWLRDLLVNRARSFVFTTAPLPVLAAALEGALDVVDAEPERRTEVHRKAALLRAALVEHGVEAPGQAPIVPVIVGDNEAAVALQDVLASEGFDARAVRPPTVPSGTARLRVTVRYPVSDEDLLRFARATGRAMEKIAQDRAVAAP